MPRNSREQAGSVQTLKWAKAPLPIDIPMPWDKVARTYVPWGACWLWTGTINSGGYGVFSRRVDGKPRQYRAHRVAYADEYGDPGPGLVIDHLCRVRACCNPHHMEAVTLGENVHRSVHTLSATCARGHERTEDNIRRDAKGRRRGCRTCEREARKARHVRDKSARNLGLPATVRP